MWCFTTGRVRLEGIGTEVVAIAPTPNETTKQSQRATALRRTDAALQSRAAAGTKTNSQGPVIALWRNRSCPPFVSRTFLVSKIRKSQKHTCLQLITFASAERRWHRLSEALSPTMSDVARRVAERVASSKVWSVTCHPWDCESPSDAGVGLGIMFGCFFLFCLALFAVDQSVSLTTG